MVTKKNSYNAWNQRNTAGNYLTNNEEAGIGKANSHRVHRTYMVLGIKDTSRRMEAQWPKCYE